MLLDNFPSVTQSPAHQLESEKMDEIIDFILQGKYSSACLLLLESTGQDPLHYIPYRTYNRLQKQRQQAVVCNVKSKKMAESKNMAAMGGRSRLTDLDYVEPLPENLRVVQGGFGTIRSNIRADRNLVSFSSQPLPIWQHRLNAS